MDGPEAWRWIWLIAAVAFALGEMATPGSFFLAPFAVGAAVAAVLAFLDVDIVWQWASFLAISVACLIALRPLARRLDRQGASDGVGSRRLIGAVGVVVDTIESGEAGLVRISSEEWRSVAVGAERIEAGTRVQVADVRGTKVVVSEIGGTE